MSLLALFLTSLSLSTDAFAAALARGSAERRPDLPTALRVGAVFGLAEGLMCLAGWMLALVMAGLIMAVDHWIALLLLGVIGGRMVRNGFDDSGAGQSAAAPSSETRPAFATVMTAIGTSIDSAAVGVAIALAGGPTWSAALIGITSFVLSSLGFLIGPRLGARFGGYAEIGGGLVLIGLGVSIFLSHTLAG